MSTTDDPKGLTAEEKVQEGLLKLTNATWLPLDTSNGPGANPEECVRLGSYHRALADQYLGVAKMAWERAAQVLQENNQDAAASRLRAYAKDVA